MTTQPQADPSAVQRRASKVARDVTALLVAVEQLTAERDRAREIAKELEREHSWKDEALAELRALHAMTPTYCFRCDEVKPCRTLRILDALAARIDAHLFPTDEVCSSCGAPLDSPGCVRGEDGRPGHTTGAGCEANPTGEEGASDE